MVPIDLERFDHPENALKSSSHLSKHHDQVVRCVGITGTVPDFIAHNPAEFTKRQKAFAQERMHNRGHHVTASAVTSHDPSTDLNDTLIASVGDLWADLVVMASHIPDRTGSPSRAHGG